MAQLPTAVYRRLPSRKPLEKVFSNYCLDFVDGYVNCGSDPSLDFSTGTLYMWTTSRDWVAAGSRWLADRNMGIPSSFQSWMAANWLIAGFCDDGGVNRRAIYDASGLTPNLWYLILWTWDFTSGVELFINNVSVATYAGAWVATLTGFNLVIGARSDGVEFWNGKIDEIGMIDRVLSAQERREVFLRGYARRLLGSRLNLRLEEGSGLTALDDSGYANNGTLMPVATPPVWTRVAKYELLAESGV